MENWNPEVKSFWTKLKSSDSLIIEMNAGNLTIQTSSDICRTKLKLENLKISVATESEILPLAIIVFGLPITAFIIIYVLRRRAKLIRDRSCHFIGTMDDITTFRPVHFLSK